MKIFNFALLGLINAQAPSPQKDCTDCLVSFCNLSANAIVGQFFVNLWSWFFQH